MSSIKNQVHYIPVITSINHNVFCSKLHSNVTLVSTRYYINIPVLLRNVKRKIQKAIRKLLTSKIVIKFNIIQLVKSQKYLHTFVHMASTILVQASRKNNIAIQAVDF